MENESRRWILWIAKIFKVSRIENGIEKWKCADFVILLERFRLDGAFLFNGIFIIGLKGRSFALWTCQ